MRVGKTALTSGAPRVLVVGPGKNVRGGMTSVITVYSGTPQWNRYRCEWLETYDDRGKLANLRAGVLALLRAPLMLAKTDVVHIHSTGATSFMRKSAFCFLAKLFHKPTILHLHVPDVDMLFKKTPLWLVKWILKSVDVVIALSPYWEAQVKSRCPQARVEVVPNPIATLQDTGTHAVGPTILWAAELQDRKGYQDLIRAFRLVVAEFPDARLMMAGHGAIERATSLATELGILGSISFPGWLRGEVKDRAFREAAVFCLPSYHEGVPMAMLEAMAFGLAVVCTPVGGICDVIADGCNGLLVKCGDVPGLAAALSRLLGDAEFRHYLGRNARYTVEETCSVACVWERLGGIYERLYTTKEQGNSIVA